MAQTNYTPIQLYYSTTAAATPTSGNLANGELAINIQDEKLYFKSIETNMHKQKSPMAETRHSFQRMLQMQESTDDSLYKESIMEIPETNEDME